MKSQAADWIKIVKVRPGLTRVIGSYWRIRQDVGGKQDGGEWNEQESKASLLNDFCHSHKLIYI